MPAPSLPLAPTWPDTVAKLHFLQSPAAHGGRVALPRLVETHMSWVVLYGDRALKLKKPVRHAFLDFSTPAAREHDAREELRLNRRLAPQVYLDVLALMWRAGEFQLLPSAEVAHPGAAADWLVLMQRLPDERMLDRMIAAGAVHPWHVEALGLTLSRFYRHAPVAPVCAEEHVARIRRELQATRTVLLDPRFRSAQSLDVLDRFDDALAAHEDLLGQRVREGRILEGHGDLRPEHVCLLEPPVVIDCLEFDGALREVDPFDELAFLTMECEVAGDAGIGPRLWDLCAGHLDDAPPLPLKHLYTARRALLRARLAAAHLFDAQPRTPERWLPRSRTYLEKAAAALQRLQLA